MRDFFDRVKDKVSELPSRARVTANQVAVRLEDAANRLGQMGSDLTIEAETLFTKSSVQALLEEIEQEQIRIGQLEPEASDEAMERLFLYLANKLLYYQVAVKDLVEAKELGVNLGLITDARDIVKYHYVDGLGFDDESRANFSLEFDEVQTHLQRYLKQESEENNEALLSRTISLLEYNQSLLEKIDTAQIKLAKHIRSVPSWGSHNKPRETYAMAIYRVSLESTIGAYDTFRGRRKGLTKRQMEELAYNLSHPHPEHPEVVKERYYLETINNIIGTKDSKHQSIEEMLAVVASHAGTFDILEASSKKKDFKLEAEDIESSLNALGRSSGELVPGKSSNQIVFSHRRQDGPAQITLTDEPVAVDAQARGLEQAVLNRMTFAIDARSNDGSIEEAAALFSDMAVKAKATAIRLSDLHRKHPDGTQTPLSKAHYIKLKACIEQLCAQKGHTMEIISAPLTQHVKPRVTNVSADGSVSFISENTAHEQNLEGKKKDLQVIVEDEKERDDDDVKAVLSDREKQGLRKPEHHEEKTPPKDTKVEVEDTDDSDDESLDEENPLHPGTKSN